MSLKIGKNVVIQSGVVLNEDGFGYKKIDSKWKLKEHKFGVVIEDDVHIGSNCTIDRGSWRDTIIGNGTKIDNAAHIAHNVIIGKNCLIHAFVNICGSCEIGNDCEIFPLINISPHVKISNNIIVGCNSFVDRDIVERGTYVGCPVTKI